MMGRRISAHWSSAALNTGSVRYRPAPIPGCCAPWPGKRKATPASWLADSRSMTARPSAPRKSCAASSGSLATTARRCAMRERPTPSVQATSARSMSLFDWRWSASCRDWRSTAAAVLALSVSTCGPCPAVAGRTAASGASSSTTWALVPPSPNELTAARRGRSERFHGRSSVFTKKGLPAKSICGLGDSKLMLGGICS